ncbi:MAG: hypothetical protein JST39_11580, partial [Bacteroidetes bacterium]|nr:hypothetical protein [Bacteroidota bacterium]
MPDIAKPNIITSFSRWLRYNFYTKKFNTVPGYIAMGLIGVAIALGCATVMPALPILIAIGIGGIVFVVAVFRYPIFGFYSSIVASASLSMPERILPNGSSLPLGLAVEALQYITLLSVIARQYRERDNVGPFWRNPITIMYLVLIAYYIIDIFNPTPHSSLGWFNYVRKQFSYLAMYYMAYIILNSYDRIMQFLRFWLILCLFIAAYGIKQQWFGMFTFENNWIQRNPEAYSLFFQAGFLRKFSILNDPATFGVLCASTLTFTL